MRDALITGFLTGLAIAVPVGAIGALIVALGARGPLRVAVAGAVGVGVVDTVYAALAVAAGAPIGRALAPYADTLRVASAFVLIAVAVLMLRAALTATSDDPGAPAVRSAVATFWVLVGLTAVNPATVTYFAAIVLGDPHLVNGVPQAVAFVVAAGVASIGWQTTLALAGSGLGTMLTSPRGRRISGIVGALMVLGFAARSLI